MERGNWRILLPHTAELGTNRQINSIYIYTEYLKACRTRMPGPLRERSQNPWDSILSLWNACAKKVCALSAVHAFF
jgi:hypothetical protein